MTNKKKSKTSDKRQNKGHHIDVRYTEEEYKQIVANAAKCGMPKLSALLHWGLKHGSPAPGAAFRGRGPYRGQTRCSVGSEGWGGDWQLRLPRKDASILEFEKTHRII